MEFDLRSNDRVFVRYRGYPLWHERIVLDQVEGREWLIATPDYHLYAELVTEHNRDLDGVRFAGPAAPGRRGRVPPGLAQVYQFEAITKEQGEALLEEGRALARDERRRRGIATPRPVAPPGLPAPVAVVAAGGGGGAAGAGVVVAAGKDPPDPAVAWRVVERTARYSCGDRHMLGASAVVLGDRAIDMVDGRALVLARTFEGESLAEFAERLGVKAEAAVDTDARVLAIQLRPGDNRRERTWQSVCEAVRETALEDFGIAGPRTSSWCMKYLQRQQMHPDDYHQRWRQRHKLTGADWGVAGHQTALRCIGLAGCSDQLDLVNLSVIEHLFREVQMIEQHYRQVERDADDKLRKEKKISGVPADEADLYLGTVKGTNDSMVCPDLQEHIAKLLERDAQISKQTRKAREERALTRK